MRRVGGGPEEAGRLNVRLLAALALLVFAASASAQTKPPLPVSDLAGDWHLFAATLSLTVAPNGIADGRFVWTLRRSPLAEEQRKLGMSAIEFVSGKVDSAAGTLTLAGTRKDDPHDVIFTDRYRLVAGENGRSLAGVSGNLGDWNGLVFLQR